MILRSIRVSGWRCFADAVAVGPFKEDLNVIHAPNATGKSTLFEAMIRALLDAHRVGGREVEALRPWGRQLTPTVTVEFAHGGHEYRITKRFLDSPSSRLERQEGGRFVSLAEAGKADDTVRAMLSRNAPGRGLSRPENWGLAQVLWITQGALALAALSGDLVSDIRSSLGQQVAEPSASPIEHKVEEAYLRIFTPGGKLRSGREAPPVAQLGEKLEAARAERAVALARQRAYEEASRRVEELRAARAQARYDAEAIGEVLKGTRDRAELFQKLTSDRNRGEESLKAEEARYADLKRRMEDIAASRTEMAEVAGSIREIETDLPLHERELRQRDREAEEARSSLEDARRDRPKVDAARELAEQARLFAENARALDALEDTLRKVAAALEALDQRKRERGELVAPDDSTLNAIRKAVKKRDEAQILIESSLIALEVVSEKHGRLIIVTGEQPGEVELSPGIPARVTGSPEVVADLPGLARLRASGPAGSVGEHRAARAEADRELQRLTRPFATSDLESLEGLIEKRRALDKSIGDAENQVETWLSGRTLDVIQRQHSELQAIRANIIQDHPDWQKTPPDPPALKAAADAASQAFVGRVEKAESDWDGAQKALDAARKSAGQLGSRAEAARTMTRSLETRLAELTADGKSDEQRAVELKGIALSWDAAKAKLEETDRKLSEFKDNPVDTADRLQRQLQGAEEAASQARDAEKTEEGKLMTLGAEGTYSLLAVLEEKVAALESEVAAEELRAGAIRLLRDTLVDCRARAVAAVAGPVESVATQMIQRIAGGRLGRLHLGDSFEPAAVVPESSGEGVSLEAVSGGEREQIYLATRLALAEVLARDERQMVVLDDVMTFTDAGRMARVMAILEEEARRLQIVVLTCHPERYRGLTGAAFLDLDALVHNARP